MSSYDYPFNERIRTLLRLENLFGKVLHNVESAHEINHHAAMISLFQILDVIDRAELKTDLLQELVRQRIVMNSLRGNPAIAENVLLEVIEEIETTCSTLRSSSIKLGETLRNNEWLMSIKKRAGIPGGVCEFDVPSYHYWLGLDQQQRKQDLESWLSPLMPLYQGLRIILHILRGSGVTVRLVAVNGAYQQMLSGVEPAQMLKITMDDNLSCFPEVSANKYAINIRFNSLNSVQRSCQYELDVDFELTLCNL